MEQEESRCAVKLSSKLPESLPKKSEKDKKLECTFSSFFARDENEDAELIRKVEKSFLSPPPPLPKIGAWLHMMEKLFFWRENPSIEVRQGRPPKAEKGGKKKKSCCAKSPFQTLTKLVAVVAWRKGSLSS